MPDSGDSRRTDAILIAIFCGALVLHLAAVTHRWTAPFLAGHEFRQAQTAITTWYIDRQDNFSLLYETPIVGKPWVSILLEVPVYEWSVVLVSRFTSLPHFMAARAVSVACFYLALAACYLLLGRFGLARPRRLFVLALVLTCPAYIFYSRAFLMDAMALMFSAWFLLGFVRTMDQRSWRWLALTTVAGTGAALVKSAVLAAWLIPAAGYGAWQLWRDLRAGGGWRGPAQTIAWGVATVAVPLGSLRAWIAYTDPLKAAHDSAWIFTSKILAQGNWGLFNLRPLLSAEFWGYLFWCWDQAIMSRWLIGLVVVAAAAIAPARRTALPLAGVFLLAQLMFPFAYAYQDYYFYACAIFLNAATGLLLLALLDSRLPRWACALACLVPFVAQVDAYRRGYWYPQHNQIRAGSDLTDALRDLTPENSVIVVGGGDWSAITPYYTQRKALMVRNGLEHDIPYMQRAFGRLADEQVSALVVYGGVRQNRSFILHAARAFDLDPDRPTFSTEFADVYVPRLLRRGIQARLRASQRYPQLNLPPDRAADLPSRGRLQISPEIAREVFYNITPAPFEAEFQYGLNWIEQGPQAVMLAHPDSDLWLRPPPGATTILWNYGIAAGAYTEPGARTNGVEFIVDGEVPDGPTRRLYYRLLDPMETLADRGHQHAVVPYAPRPGEVLRFSTRPHENSAYDWAYWISIDVH